MGWLSERLSRGSSCWWGRDRGGDVFKLFPLLKPEGWVQHTSSKENHDFVTTPIHSWSHNHLKYKSPPKGPMGKCTGIRHTVNSCFLLPSFAILMMLGLISIMDTAFHNSSSSCPRSAEFPTVAWADTIKYVELCGYFMLWINNHMESYLQY